MTKRAPLTQHDTRPHPVNQTNAGLNSDMPSSTAWLRPCQQPLIFGGLLLTTVCVFRPLLLITCWLPFTLLLQSPHGRQSAGPKSRKKTVVNSRLLEGFLCVTGGPFFLLKNVSRSPTIGARPNLIFHRHLSSDEDFYICLSSFSWNFPGLWSDIDNVPSRLFQRHVATNTLRAL